MDLRLLEKEERRRKEVSWKPFRHAVMEKLDELDRKLNGIIALVNQGFALVTASQQREEHDMSVLSDKIAGLNTELDAAIARVQQTVDGLKAQIAALQAQVDAGTATQADLDALDAAKAKLAALDPTNPTVLPTK